MKIAVISDIHSNLEALNAVLKDIEADGVDRIYCLGDIVGYGPHPHECLETVRAKASGIIRGNHEDTLCHPDDAEEKMSDMALAGIRFAAWQLSEEELVFIESLPSILTDISLGFIFAHGSPDDVWEYIEDEDRAQKVLEKTTQRICLVGHTHIPFIFDDKNGLHETFRDGMVLDSDRKFLINVGSVGQPRDEDNRAGYALLEISTEGVIKFSLPRINYAIGKTADAIREAGLPAKLAKRLFVGI